jgi:hypothetical protein
MPDRIREPWLSFLRNLDQALKETVEVHCLGGFALGVLWGLPRPTGDVDFEEELRPYLLLSRTTGQELGLLIGVQIRVGDHEAPLKIDYRLDQIAEAPGRQTTQLVEGNRILLGHGPHEAEP